MLYHGILTILLFSQCYSSENQKSNSKLQQIYLTPLSTQDKYIKAYVLAPYSQYIPQYAPQYVPYTYPSHGNIYFPEGNFYDGSSYRNIYSRSMIPYQQGYIGSYFDRYSNIPTQIIDLDQNGKIIQQNLPFYNIRQGKSQVVNNFDQLPRKVVKTNFVTTKPITITINRSSGSKDSVINYNYKNGELQGGKTTSESPLSKKQNSTIVDSTPK
ncbi:hypothetical protein WA026_019133 [Henosepilachna vigintioctopunctata]|uniref:Uncharacterized protein n=1 Tax=Henosepilachna vigintioctopunctata TaxID=420089 RepID=A0AAW1V0B8_9CUCU